MARGRMISKSLSTSEKFAALIPVAGDLAEFCQALYPLLLIHTDDFGRLQGDPFTVKTLCFPASPRTLLEFAAALAHLHRSHLITTYVVLDKTYIQITDFDAHQMGLHKRTRSRFPRIPGTSGNFPEFPVQEKRTKEKRTKEKYPPTPLKKGGPRLTRADVKHAKEVRAKVFGRCPHEPHCANYDACVRAIALERRDKAAAPS